MKCIYNRVILSCSLRRATTSKMMTSLSVVILCVGQTDTFVKKKTTNTMARIASGTVIVSRWDLTRPEKTISTKASRDTMTSTDIMTSALCDEKVVRDQAAVKQTESIETRRCTVRWPLWHAALPDNYRLSQRRNIAFSLMKCIWWYV